MLDIKISDIPKLLKPQYLLVVTVATGLVLFLPEAVVDKLGFVALKTEVRMWFGVAFIAAASLLIAQIVSLLFSHFVLRPRLNAIKQRQLHSLTLEEQVILRRYIGTGTKTLELVVNNGVVTGLIGKDALYLASPMGYQNLAVSYTDCFGQVNIQDWAWEYLQENPHLLGLDTRHLRQAA